VDTDPTPVLRPRSAQRLFEAARELLAEKPAAELTVREIAARAGVQHTLIGRHFGGRDALLALVVAEALARFAAAVDAAGDLAAALRVGLEQFSTNRALASGMAVFVVGHDVGELARYPLADAYEGQLLRAGMGPGQARDTAVMVIALMSGWVVGQRFFLGMAGRRDDPQVGREMVERAVWALVDQAMHETDNNERGSNTCERRERSR
jgi:AcrR family transcriptional regulator